MISLPLVARHEVLLRKLRDVCVMVVYCAYCFGCVALCACCVACCVVCVGVALCVVVLL